MIMIYSAPLPAKIAQSVTAKTSRRFASLLLPLSFCVLLIGCDSQSANSPIVNDATGNRSRSDTATQMPTVDSKLLDQQENERAEIENSDDSADDDDSGQSLIAAAKMVDGSQRRPMISEQRHNSALQATLIGDYTGMLPCSMCDGIAMTLNLFADGSVLKNSIYENPETPQAPLTESGIYRQDNNKITIVYEDKAIETYDIQDNHLVMMDAKQTPDPDYTLSRK